MNYTDTFTNYTLDDSYPNQTYNTTQLPKTNNNNSSLAIVILFGLFVVFIGSVCFYISCLPRAINNSDGSFYGSIVKLSCLITLDMLGLILCYCPKKENYCNEGAPCDILKSKLKYILCPCKKKKPKIEIIELFEIINTQPIDRNEICTICYEEIGKGKHGELKCGHKFHKKCISLWMDKSLNKDCPLCRN
jgi:hypothetical protein